MRFFSSLVCYALFRSRKFCGTFFILGLDFYLQDYGKKIVPHGLRHNFATVGIRAGMDIASLALMMGHASRAMTLDTYGDANADALTLASVKLKDTFNENTAYFELEEAQEEEERSITTCLL